MKQLFVFLISAFFVIQSKASEPDFSIHSGLLAQAQASDLKLEDLGFDSATLQADPKEAELLQKRSKQLKLHQIMGLTTLALMTATVFTGPEDEPADDLHKGLGIATATSYAATAYLSLTAPEPKQESHKGFGMKMHRALLFVHLPGMILTPIAGLKANQQLKNHEEPSGLAKQKKNLAYMTYAAFAAAAISVSFDF